MNSTNKLLCYFIADFLVCGTLLHCNPGLSNNAVNKVKIHESHIRLIITLFCILNTKEVLKSNHNTFIFVIQGYMFRFNELSSVIRLRSTRISNRHNVTRTYILKQHHNRLHYILRFTRTYKYIYIYIYKLTLEDTFMVISVLYWTLQKLDGGK
jgi:hypothetical protein